MRSSVALPGLALALLFAAVASPSRAEQASAWKSCFGKEQNDSFPGFIPTSDATIPACTRLLNGGQLNTQDQLIALFRRAEALRSRRQFARAIADYDRMIALGERTDRIYYNRGITYSMMGRRAEAVRDLQAAAQSSDSSLAGFARKALQDIADRDAPKPKIQALPRQRDDTPLIDELRRKGNAREQEDGFCSRLPWPNLTLQQIAGFLDSSAVGSMLFDKDDTSCELKQVVLVSNLGGARCVRTQEWACYLGKRCQTSFTAHCKEGAGYRSYNCSCP